MIKIITVGTIKEKYLKDAIEEYQKRIKKYTNIELIEVKDEGLVEESKAIILEAEKIKKHLNSKDYVITMEIEGKQITSEEFAERLEDGRMIEATVFRDWCYGTSFENLNEDKINIGVFNPAGIDILNCIPDVAVLAIYITAEDKIRMLR